MARLGHILLALGCVALAFGTLSTPAVAQVAEGQAVPPGARRTLQEAVASAVAQAPPAPSRKRSAKRGAVRGALIGAAVGAGAAVGFAAAYGNNEGGGLCVACLATWGLAVTGAGTAIGASVGAAIGAAAPSRQPGAWPPAGARPPGPRRDAAFTVRFQPLRPASAIPAAARRAD